MSRYETLVKFVTFGVVGGTGLLVNLGVTYVLTQYAGLWYFFSFIIATFVSWNVVFFANSLFTFRGHPKEHYARRYATFMLGYLGIFFFNAALVYTLTSILHFYYLLSITFVTALSTILTFLFSKKFVYHRGSTR